MSDKSNSTSVTPEVHRTVADDRVVRVFVSSTFKDMVEDRNELMTQVWPALREFCKSRSVEFVEVDLRWGITEAQSQRNETLRFILAEIRRCRTCFVGLLGERYGWTPGPDSLTHDLLQEEPWLNDLHDRSVTEIEMLHGVLRERRMSQLAFFYFRDPQYLGRIPPGRNPADFISENPEDKVRLDQLKQAIRQASLKKNCSLRENYKDPRELARFVLADLMAAIEEQCPAERVPDPIDRAVSDQESFAETRRRTYICRHDYYDTLDRHASCDGSPLAVVGDAGSGKTALLANWAEHWRTEHPGDYVFQHYTGSSPGSADRWYLIRRLIAEIKRWTDDADDLPTSHDDLLRDLPLWIAKARSRADKNNVRFIVTLDAIDQLERDDQVGEIGWLPSQPFTGAVRLIVSTRPGTTLDAIVARSWQTMIVEPLAEDERRRLIENYLGRFGKKLDPSGLHRLASAPAAANPLYLRTVLDELRVSGTYECLNELLNDYLSAPDIPALLQKMLVRCRRDYERDRSGLVEEALGLIWAARRGLTEDELLRLLKAENETRLATAIWNPLRFGLEQSLVDQGGILNFAHDYFRKAVEAVFIQSKEARDRLRLRLADFFEVEPLARRSCDELPWLLRQADKRDRLRLSLLDIPRFSVLFQSNAQELLSYWVWLGEERAIGEMYLASLEKWRRSGGPCVDNKCIELQEELGAFLRHADLYAPAVALLKQVVDERMRDPGIRHPSTLRSLNLLTDALKSKGDYAQALELCGISARSFEETLGGEDPEALRFLNNYGELLAMAKIDLVKAESCFRTALEARKRLLGPEHRDTLVCLQNLAATRGYQGSYAEAESLLRTVFDVRTRVLGRDHPETLDAADNLAYVLRRAGKIEEAERLSTLAMEGMERVLGFENPCALKCVHNHAAFLRSCGRHEAAAALYRRASVGFASALGPEHESTLLAEKNLAMVLHFLGNFDEAQELLLNRWSACKNKFGPDEPITLDCGNDVVRLYEQMADDAVLLSCEGNYADSERLLRFALQGVLKVSQINACLHPSLNAIAKHYADCLKNIGNGPDEVLRRLNEVVAPFELGLRYGYA